MNESAPAWPDHLSKRPRGGILKQIARRVTPPTWTGTSARSRVLLAGFDGIERMESHRYPRGGDPDPVAARRLIMADSLVAPDLPSSLEGCHHLIMQLRTALVSRAVIDAMTSRSPAVKDA